MGCGGFWLDFKLYQPNVIKCLREGQRTKEKYQIMYVDDTLDSAACHTFKNLRKWMNSRTAGDAFWILVWSFYSKELMWNHPENFPNNRVEFRSKCILTFNYCIRKNEPVADIKRSWHQSCDGNIQCSLEQCNWGREVVLLIQNSGITSQRHKATSAEPGQSK